MSDFLSNGRFSEKVFETPEASLREKDPIGLFKKLLLFCKEKEERTSLYNAMTLSTLGSEGRVSSRVMLLKAIVDEKLYFFTHYDSRKAEDVAYHPQVSALFYWPLLNRQVVVDGICQKAKRDFSEAYFASRPRLSQIGAHASKQSRPLKDREEFMERFSALEREFEGGEVPCPETWGGFEISVSRIEFWKGAEGRLHERIVFERAGDSWSATLLNP